MVTYYKRRKKRKTADAAAVVAAHDYDAYPCEMINPRNDNH